MVLYFVRVQGDFPGGRRSLLRETIACIDVRVEKQLLLLYTIPSGYWSSAGVSLIDGPLDRIGKTDAKTNYMY